MIYVQEKFAGVSFVFFFLPDVTSRALQGQWRAEKRSESPWRRRWPPPLVSRCPLGLDQCGRKESRNGERRIHKACEKPPREMALQSSRMSERQVSPLTPSRTFQITIHIHFSKSFCSKNIFLEFSWIENFYYLSKKRVNRKGIFASASGRSVSKMR